MSRAEADNGQWCRLATKLDLVCFNINYRLGPEAQTPENFEDGVAAFKYFKQNAVKYGGDPNSLSIYGSSAGAWVAIGTTFSLVREGGQD